MSKIEPKYDLSSEKNQLCSHQNVNKKSVFDIKLDLEEQALLRSVENGEWKRVDDFEAQVAFAKEATVNTLSYRATIQLE